MFVLAGGNLICFDTVRDSAGWKVSSAGFCR